MSTVWTGNARVSGGMPDLQELWCKQMRIMNNYIFLSDVRFHAFHGVMPQERTVGADFAVSVRIGYDFSQAAHTDEVADTLSYADVFDILKEEMAVPSRLLEHVAGRMVNAIRQKFVKVESIDLTLTKLNPPMGADCAGAGVEMHWTS